MHTSFLTTSELAEDTIHCPIDRRGREAGTGTDGAPLQMLDHVLDERILHVRGIGHRDALIALTRLQTDGIIVED